MIATPTDGLITATGVSTRDPSGSLDLIAEVAAQLPAGLTLTGPTGLGRAISHHRSVTDAGGHLKCALTNARGQSRNVRPIANARGQRRNVPIDGAVEPLGPGDVGQLADLYRSDPGAAFFLPSMVGDRSFVGIRDDDGRLVAAGGTHLVSDRQRLAAIGSVLVRPDARNRGLGHRLMLGVLDRLGGRCDVIGLNVATDNAPARALYESLGFHPVIEYEEASLA